MDQTERDRTKLNQTGDIPRPIRASCLRLSSESTGPLVLTIQSAYLIHCSLVLVTLLIATLGAQEDSLMGLSTPRKVRKKRSKQIRRESHDAFLSDSKTL